jgi:hypothetical protein
VRIAVGLGLTFLLAGTAAVAIPLVQSLGDPARTAAGTTRAVPPAPAPQPSPAASEAMIVSPPSSSEVRQALTGAGYRDALVRVARPDDPAPRGSVLVAVPAGAACVVIHHNGYPHRTVAGRLPDGSCLSG